MNTEKKWILAHDFCANDLGGEIVLPGELSFWAEKYAAGMAAPVEAIPGLIRAFESVPDSAQCPGGAIEYKVRAAIAKLREQLADKTKGQEEDCSCGGPCCKAKLF